MNGFAFYQALGVITVLRRDMYVCQYDWFERAATADILRTLPVVVWLYATSTRITCDFTFLQVLGPRRSPFIISDGSTA